MKELISLDGKVYKKAMKTFNKIFDFLIENKIKVYWGRFVQGKELVIKLVSTEIYLEDFENNDCKYSYRVGDSYKDGDMKSFKTLKSLLNYIKQNFK